jgi:hypothetical protein
MAAEEKNVLKPMSLLLLLVLTACGFGRGEPTVIDGSSAEAFSRTLGEAKSDLGPKERLKFEAAYAEYKAQVFADADNRQEYERLLREGMDGLTGPRIVAKFDENTEKARNDAADAIFDAKRALKGNAKPAQ